MLCLGLSEQKIILGPAWLLGWDNLSPVLLPGLQVWDGDCGKLVNIKSWD